MSHGGFHSSRLTTPVTADCDDDSSQKNSSMDPAKVDEMLLPSLSPVTLFQVNDLTNLGPWSSKNAYEWRISSHAPST